MANVNKPNVSPLLSIRGRWKRSSSLANERQGKRYSQPHRSLTIMKTQVSYYPWCPVNTGISDGSPGLKSCVGDEAELGATAGPRFFHKPLGYVSVTLRLR